jgi:aspartate carbamoyltransferase catalytic subunit
MSLRTQLERHHEVYFESLNEYAKDYCITEETLGDRDILLLHPGPVNRNVDISDAMLKDPRCKVLQQVSNGVAVRMAILKKLLG